MPPRDWFLRLEDMLAAIQKIETYTDGLDFSQFESESIRVDAVVRNLTVIGEAANHVPEEIRAQLPRIPWAKATELRNFVVHEYFGITLEVIWLTTTARLPSLKKEIMDTLKLGREAFPKVPLKRAKRKPAKRKK